MNFYAPIFTGEARDDSWQVILARDYTVICADLRGPTACEVLDPAQVEAVVSKLGPDPLIDPGPEAEERFTSAVRKT